MIRYLSPSPFNRKLSLSILLAAAFLVLCNVGHVSGQPSLLNITDADVVGMNGLNATNAPAVPPAAPASVLSINVDFDMITTRGYTHGWMMAIAWSFFVPVAIGSSLLRHLIGTPYWIKIHIVSNSMAFLLTTIGFGLVVRNIQDLQVFGMKHFTKDVPHRLIGLIVYLLMFVQVASGILRPHPAAAAPATNNDDKNNDIEEAQDQSGSETPASTSSKSTARFLFEIGHRTIGFGVLILALYNCHNGIRRLEFLESAMNSDYSHLIVALWSVSGGIGGLVTILYVGTKNLSTAKTTPPASSSLGHKDEKTESTSS